MDTQYISNQGKRLKLYKLRGNDYFAIDNDIANFFGIEKKYLLKATAKHKAIYGKQDRILLTAKELKKISDTKNANSKAKVFAFTINGILNIPFDIKKNDFSRKMSADIVKESANNITKMARVMRLAKRLEERKKLLTCLIVGLELCKNRMPQETTEEYNKYQEDIGKMLSDIHCMRKSIENDVITVKKMMKGIPKNFKKTVFI